MVFIVEAKGLIVRTKLPSNSSGQAFPRFVAQRSLSTLWVCGP